ncbi:DUF5718 family protein [Halarcobacter bivalviorum]|uniref:DUF5718 family protein n=1 Tax=Halarcobacter bivalviorum TaxID=663364 RepID=UPI00100B1986|nr:DUF5718 family protein [Halarcobacter bivalviorum]RXK06097.1 hypothetical protein CRU97_06140 [Halarcobacter bivalviorum]
MNKNQANLEELKDYLGFGVAGNFANHLGEAGEADEFSVIETKEKDAPKGLFPFYIPNHDSFLGEYPISTDIINHNNMDKLQVEAEVALLCDFVYEDEKLVDIVPKLFGAFNDCSNRVQDGNKLSTKKNWGPNSKGLASDLIEIDSFEENGILSKYHIASFVRRDGILKDYGTVSAVKSYSYFFNQLKEWMIDKFNTQEDMGPLEELKPFIQDINKYKGLLIAAGATAYTDFGKHNFLEKGDEIFVYVYDAHFHSFEDIIQDMSGMDLHLSKCSKLHQIVE